jgi:hypothetical protein
MLCNINKRICTIHTPSLPITGMFLLFPLGPVQDLKWKGISSVKLQILIFFLFMGTREILKRTVCSATMEFYHDLI